jgi:hypothetical protein
MSGNPAGPSACEAGTPLRRDVNRSLKVSRLSADRHALRYEARLAPGRESSRDGKMLPLTAGKPVADGLIETLNGSEVEDRLVRDVDALYRELLAARSREAA